MPDDKKKKSNKGGGKSPALVISKFLLLLFFFFFFGLILSLCHNSIANLAYFFTADTRFADIQNDPRYRLPSKRQTHVKLDKRFSHMLRDKDFSGNAAVDKYGRKLARDDTKKQLKKFYLLDENEEGEEEGKSESSIDDDREVQRELKKLEGRSYDPAREGGYSESSSSESESSSDEDTDDNDDEIEDGNYDTAELEFPDKQQSDVPMGEVTDRIAVVNLDWENIRAEDLMAVFSSFLPSGGRVLHVSVYPSEFGKERMEREEVEGPPREIFAGQKGDDEEEEEYSSDEDSDEGSDEEGERIKKSMLREDKGEEFNSTQLRQYQLERLRYFYAILTFSSKEAAKRVYDLVDGAEYLSSANFFDLRFVPDDVDFSGDKPRDECERIPDGYRPNDFVTDALQHSKVKLTWDADDKSRYDMQARLFSKNQEEIDDNDLKAYLASDNSDDEDEREDDQVEVVDASTSRKDESGASSKASRKEEEKQRKRALLGLSTEQTKPTKASGPVGEMEVTFTSGLVGEPSRETVFENEPEPEETTIDKYVRKERERKKRRKERIKATKSGEGLPGDGKEDEENKYEPRAAGAGDKSGKQKQQPEEEKEDLGFDDPFFEDPDSKDTAKARRKEEKRKKREEREADEAAAASQRAELELLMMDDKQSEIKHFDMNEVEKAEKQARKKKGKKKNNKAAARDNEDGENVDNFRMKVDDPRFARLFENHEFAIDPTNPRYKATSGMKALLEEGRKRRRDLEAVDDYGAPEEGSQKRNKKKKGSDSVNAKGDDLKRLVENVKRKAQKE